MTSASWLCGGGGHLDTTHSPSETQDTSGASNPPPNTLKEKAAPPADSPKLQSHEGAAIAEGETEGGDVASFSRILGSRLKVMEEEGM